MDPFTALRRSLILQVVGLTACHGGDKPYPDTGKVDPSPTDTDLADTDEVPDTSVPVVDDTDVVDTDTGVSGGPGGPIDTGANAACAGQVDPTALDVGSRGDTGMLLSCTTTYASLQDCLTGCDAACLSMLADDLSASWDTGGSGILTYLECGPVWVNGECCAVVRASPYQVGRPLRVGELSRTAPTAIRHGWTDLRPTGLPPSARRDVLVRAWTQRALAEHASIASFARVQLELLGLGAPADLIADVTRAMSDEIAHARVCFGVASAWSGADLGPGPLDLTGVVPATEAAKVLVAIAA